jgi:glucan phosphoethanolaminetransferase (alkaline phosphatase superfamily)
MAPYFPQVTGTFKYEEMRAFRRFSRSLVEMALVTGVLLRIYRAVVLSFGPNESLTFLAASFAFGLVLLCTSLTLHLGNFTPRRWLWRAPLFALVEAAAESATSLLLIALHREPVGSARATFADWPELAIDTVFWRLVAVLPYVLALAGVVWLVRTVLERRGEGAGARG